MSTWIDADGRRHVAVQIGGKRIHRRLPQGATARAAKQLEAELRQAMQRSPARPVIPGDPLLTDLLNGYVEYAQRSLRSPDTAKYHAARIAPWAEKYRASQARECAAHIMRDMAGHYAAATINRSLGTLKKALSLAYNEGKVPQNYGDAVTRLPEHNQRTTTITIADVQKLADAASETVRAAIWIALFTGCRRGEIIAMQPEDVQGNAITIHAGNTKTLKTRLVPVAPPLRPWLTHLPLPITAEGLKTGFQRARVKAGMSHVNFHDLRRSCGTLMIEAGVDLYVVSKLLGHSSVAVTESRYAHLQIERVAQGLMQTFARNAPENAPGKKKAPRRVA